MYTRPPMDGDPFVSRRIVGEWRIHCRVSVRVSRSAPPPPRLALTTEQHSSAISQGRRGIGGAVLARVHSAVVTGASLLFLGGGAFTLRSCIAIPESLPRPLMAGAGEGHPKGAAWRRKDSSRCAAGASSRSVRQVSP